MRTFYMGDIHGKFGYLFYFINTYDISNANIIQLGDFGVGFSTLEKERRWLMMHHDKLVKRNIFLWVVRGNHDYKPYFDNDPFGLTNIKLVPDYHVLNLKDVNILCLGGAISVDRKMRMSGREILGDFSKSGNPGASWWPDENFILDVDKLDKFRNIDVVVSHTAPSYCIPDNSLGFGANVESIISATGDSDLKSDLNIERVQMNNAFEILKINNYIKFHYYGHFHLSDAIAIDGTVHRALNINELWEENDEYYNNC